MNIIDTIRNSPYLRSLLLLCFILVVGLLFVLNESHKVRTNALELYESTLDNQRHLIELQQILIKEQENPTVLSNQFTKFEEVIPFITTLENIFKSVDPEIQVNLQGDEDEISSQLQARYVVLLPEINSTNAFKKSMSELYSDARVLEVQDLVVTYAKGQISSAQFMVKLHLF